MIRKLAIVGAIVTGVVALVAGPAFAHVEIEREGKVGTDGVVAATLHVPNEETNAGTTKGVLVLPGTPQLTVAEPEAVNGWTATVEKSAAGDVTQVTWTGGPLAGAEKVALPLKIGDVPADVDAVVFKAVQTYDDGTEVSWIEPTPAGGEEPEHPAPVLTVRAQQPVDDDAAATDHQATTTTKAKSDDSSSTGTIIAIVRRHRHRARDHRVLRQPVATRQGKPDGLTDAAGTAPALRAKVGPWLTTGSRLVLAVVWAWAGWAKIADPDAATRAVRAYEIFPEFLVKPIAWGLPFVELGLALLLVIGLACRPAAWVSAVLFLGFIVMIGSAWARGLSIDCGCFGGGGATNGVDGAKYAEEIVRDLVLLGLAVFVAVGPDLFLSLDRRMNG